MSTILKALRRVEGEKQREANARRQHAEIAGSGPATGIGPKPGRRIAVLAGLGLLVAMGAGAWLWAADSAEAPKAEAAPRGVQSPKPARRVAAEPAPPIARAPQRAARRSEAIANARAIGQVPLPARGGAARVAAVNEPPARSPSSPSSHSPRAASESAALRVAPAPAPARAPAPPPVQTSSPAPSPTPAPEIAVISPPAPVAPAPAPPEAKPAPPVPVPERVAEKAKEEVSEKEPSPASPADNAAAASPWDLPPAPEPPPVVQGVRVLRTVWHPVPGKRIAYVSAAAGEGAPVELREGEIWRTLKVSEIKLSSVIFESEGQDFARKVGANP